MVTGLHTLAARFDPDTIATPDVNGVITDLGQALRLIQGMTTLIARRTRDTVGGSGDQGAAARLARATGDTPTAARRTLQTSTRLNDQTDVAQAIRAGQLSATQAEAICDAVAADPTATSELLQAAAQQTVADLRRTCRDRRMTADPDRDATRARHVRNRSFRSWLESDGEWKAVLSGPADHGARIQAALRADHDQVFRQAHAARRREPDAAYRYDALLAVLERGATTSTSADTPADQAADPTGDSGGEPATTDTVTADPARSPAAPTTDTTAIAGRPGGGQPRRRSGRQTKVIITVPAAALKRDRLNDGETCTIAGIGQVSLAAVKALIPDAHIAYLIHDAVDATVAHLGRQVTAHQRTALEARGYECEVPHCRASHLLEIDHIRDWAWSKQTALHDLAWHCHHHHADKTLNGYRLSGPPGHRTWTDPTGHTISHDPTPTATPGARVSDQPDPPPPDPADPHPNRPPDQADPHPDQPPASRTDRPPDQPDTTPVTAWADRLPDQPDPTAVIAHLPDHHIISAANRDCHRAVNSIRRRHTILHAGWHHGTVNPGKAEDPRARPQAIAVDAIRSDEVDPAVFVETPVGTPETDGSASAVRRDG